MKMHRVQTFLMILDVAKEPGAGRGDKNKLLQTADAASNKVFLLLRVRLFLFFEKMLKDCWNFYKVKKK